jgi:hypothetical protein
LPEAKIKMDSRFRGNDGSLFAQSFHAKVCACIVAHIFLRYPAYIVKGMEIEVIKSGSDLRYLNCLRPLLVSADSVLMGTVALRVDVGECQQLEIPRVMIDCPQAPAVANAPG